LWKAIVAKKRASRHTHISDSRAKKKLRIAWTTAYQRGYKRTRSFDTGSRVQVIQAALAN
jgi:hypothetical protein